MKNHNILITLLSLLLFAGSITAQQVSIQPAGATTDNSAMLDIASSDKGLLIPRMDSTSRKNIVNPAEGLMVFDSTYHSYWYFDGSAWASLNGLDHQDLQLSNDVLSLTNDASTIPLADFKQDLSLGINDSLRLSNAPTAIDFAHYKDNLGNHIATQNIQLGTHYLSNDGSAGKGIYVDTLGGVKLNTATFPFLPTKLHVEFEQPTTTELAINMSQAPNITFTQVGCWQSFTIPYDGYLTHFYLYGQYDQLEPSSFTLYKGEGTGGEVLATGAISFPGAFGRTHLAPCLFSNTPVYKGEVYTVQVNILRSLAYVQFNSVHTTNPYSGGRSSYNAAYDVRFSSFIIPAPVGYQFRDTALLLNNYSLPLTDGNPNEILVTDGAGKVNWANANSGAVVDHLGNHTMTQDLRMNGHWINNDGGVNKGVFIDTLGWVGINTSPEANLHVPMGATPNPGFRITDTLVSINEYSLPVVDGMANQTLATDGAGQMTWTTVAAAAPNQQLSLSNDTLSLTNGGPPINLAPYLDADNLGNHTASQNLYTNTFGIQNTASDTTGVSLDTYNALNVISSSTRPAEFLTTQAGKGNYIEVANDGNIAMARFGAGGSDFIPGGNTSAVAIGNFNNTGDFNMWTGFAERMKISVAGNVGIGRTPTTNLLEVNGAASKSTAGNWLANSDARLKRNILKLDTHDMLDKLLSLQGIRYEWADHQTGTKRPAGFQYGFTAQNIQEVFPTLVSEDQQGYLQTAYGTYDAMTVEAIRALNHKFEKLDAQTSELEQEMAALAELRSKILKSSAKK